MDKQTFLDLSVMEQDMIISESGVLLISYEKDDSSVSFHRLHHLFVKTISKEGGYRYVEVHTSQKIFNFAEFSND